MVEIEVHIRGRNALKMLWQKMRNAFTFSNVNNASMIRNSKKDLVPMIPLRSGYLMDTIFRSLNVTRSQQGNDFFIDMSPDYPTDRPTVFSGRVQHFQEQGYGEHYSPKDPMVPPTFIRKTAYKATHNPQTGLTTYWSSGRSSIYRLHDPVARQDTEQAIVSVLITWLQDEMHSIFSKFKNVKWKMNL